MADEGRDAHPRQFGVEELGAPFRVPKDITFIEALPRNPSGKVLKCTLKEKL
jgi:acyl-coenzyme A synthetase/AMP-(fatty) acid ligase